MSIKRDIASLERAERGLRLAERYPDGRTIPQAGDRVFTFVPAVFGSEGVMQGEVIERRGALAVRVKEASSMLGGRQILARARVYPLGRSWTLHGEEHPSRRAMREAGEEGTRERKRLETEKQARKAEGAVLRAAGRQLLSDVIPRVGMRIRHLNPAIGAGSIVEIDPRFGPLVVYDSDPPGTGGRTMGNDLSEWVIVQRREGPP